jgi:hypothetical protein
MERGVESVFVSKQFPAKSELCSIAVSRQISGSSQVPAKSLPSANSTGATDSVRLREGWFHDLSLSVLMEILPFL